MFGLTPFENRGFDIFDPFRGFDEEFHRNSFAPCRTDIKDEGDKFVLEADVPGMKKEDLKVEVNDGVLTISADYDEHTEQKDEDSKYVYRERRCGSVRRAFNVEGIREDGITARFQDGVLTLELPKCAPEEKPVAHTIEING